VLVYYSQLRVTFVKSFLAQAPWLFAEEIGLSFFSRKIEDPKLKMILECNCRKLLFFFLVPIYFMVANKVKDVHLKHRLSKISKLTTKN
jgi:hypothetical protein